MTERLHEKCTPSIEAYLNENHRIIDDFLGDVVLPPSSLQQEIDRPMRRLSFSVEQGGEQHSLSMDRRHLMLAVLVQQFGTGEERHYGEDESTFIFYSMQKDGQPFLLIESYQIKSNSGKPELTAATITV